MSFSSPLISGDIFTSFLSSLAFVLFFIFSTYGFGRLIAQYAYPDPKLGFAYVTTIGIAGWIIFGGVLNLLKFAYPNVLLVSLVFGSLSTVGFTLSRIYRSSPAGTQDTDLSPLKYSLSLANVPYAVILASVLMFCAFFLMPSGSFNYHDDFNSYFYRPVQLLAEGSFKSNIFTQFGYNSLGGQDFMKAFPLIFFDSSYANTFDTVICFFVGLALIFEYGKSLNSKFPLTILAGTLFIVINPQIVNSSSVYSGTLLIIGLTLSCLYLQKPLSHNTPSARHLIASTIPVALFYSALTTLKANLIIYAVLFFFIKLLLELLFLRPKKAVLLSNLSVLFIGFLFVLPWLLSPSSKYFDALMVKIPKLFTTISHSAHSVVSTQTETTSQAGNTISALFSTRDLLYGASYPDYLALISFLLGISLICFLSLFRQSKDFPLREAVVLSSAALTPILSLLIMVGMTDSPQTALRYNIPLIIALVPIGLVFAARRFPLLHLTHATHFRRAFSGFALIIVGMFSAPLIDRVERIVYQRHVLSFPIGRSYLHHSLISMDKLTLAEFRKAQSTIENGAKVLAWVGTPFHLDFTRQDFTVFESPESDPDFPLNTDIETLWKYLRGYGFDFIIWQSHGFAVKRSDWYRGKKGLTIKRLSFFRDTIPRLANATELVYREEGIWVLDIRNFKAGDS